jgi:hypothetical protein
MSGYHLRAGKKDVVCLEDSVFLWEHSLGRRETEASYQSHSNPEPRASVQGMTSQINVPYM